MVNCIWTIWKAFWEPIFIRNQPFYHLLERPVYLLGSHLVFGLDFGHLKSILGSLFHQKSTFEHLLKPPGHLLGNPLVSVLNFGISDGHLKSILGAHFHQKSTF